MSNTQPGQQLVEKTCIICGKPMQVKVKIIRAKWGKTDWKHQACYRRNMKTFQEEAYE